jgi:hypothetical protein
LAPSVRAASRCYSPAELRAEQLLRLHSELMVIALACRQASTGQDLIGAYTGFTRDHIGMLKNAEHTMIRYYHMVSGGSGIAGLDRLRTRLGNEYGQEIADDSAPVFCRAKRDLVLAIRSATPPQLDRDIRRMEMTEASYHPLCGAPSRPADLVLTDKGSSAVVRPPIMIVPVVDNIGGLAAAGPEAPPAAGDSAAAPPADAVQDHSTNTNMHLVLPPGTGMDK